MTISTTTVLFYAASYPRTVFLMRTTLLTHIYFSAAKFGDNLLNAFRDVVANDFNDDQTIQISLSIRSGGMGLRRCTDHKVVAFIASWINSYAVVVKILLSMNNINNDQIYDYMQVEMQLVGCE